MAKKVVATLKTGTGKQFTKCIKMVKSEKTGAYMGAFCVFVRTGCGGADAGCRLSPERPDGRAEVLGV
mgnify:CR=1 FL=1